LDILSHRVDWESENYVMSSQSVSTVVNKPLEVHVKPVASELKNDDRTELIEHMQWQEQSERIHDPASELDSVASQIKRFKTTRVTIMM
jgi:hypothetical protein